MISIPTQISTILGAVHFMTLSCQMIVLSDRTDFLNARMGFSVRPLRGKKRLQRCSWQWNESPRLNVSPIKEALIHDRDTIAWALADFWRILKVSLAAILASA